MATGDWRWIYADWPEPSRRPWWPGRRPSLDSFDDQKFVTLKHDPSGLVTAGTVDGIDVVLKTPASPKGGRRLIAPLRPARAKRAFDKTRLLLNHGLPVEVPIALGRRHATWAALYGRIPGETLAGYDGPELAHVMNRVGCVLRQTTAAGWVHSDAKLTNWIVTPEGEPVICDCDGLRRQVLRTRARRGLDRVLQDLRQLPQFDKSHEAALLDGFTGGGEI